MVETELNKFESQRLVIDRLRISDFAVINGIMNSEGFIKYIGDRNIRSDEDSKAYIAKTLENNNIQYWIVRQKPELTPVGMVSFVKRDFLPHHDIGYAFLPEYTGKGFAYEATAALLQRVLLNYENKPVLAFPNKDNIRSVHLIEKMGFEHTGEIEREGKLLQLYEINAAQFAKKAIGS